MTAKYEAGRSRTWTLNLPESTVAGLMNAVVAFSIRVTRIKAKFKLGQNRSAEDWSGMLAALSSSDDAGARELAKFIRDICDAEPMTKPTVRPPPNRRATASHCAGDTSVRP